MASNSLEAWRRAVRSSWDPLNTGLVAEGRLYMEKLVQADPSEKWLADLHAQALATEQLYCDPDHGFILSAHTEPVGQYRTPHDHGASWVIYAVQSGVVDMGTYARVEQPNETFSLIKRDSSRMVAGQVQVYLPGDIHDTLCVAGPALLLRFTQLDLREEKVTGSLKRYVEKDGHWTVAAN